MRQIQTQVLIIASMLALGSCHDKDSGFSLNEDLLKNSQWELHLITLTYAGQPDAVFSRDEMGGFRLNFKADQTFIKEVYPYKTIITGTWHYDRKHKKLVLENQLLNGTVLNSHVTYDVVSVSPAKLIISDINPYHYIIDNSSKAIYELHTYKPVRF